MHYTHFWNKFSLYWQKIIVVFFCLTFVMATIDVYGQSSKVVLLPKFDSKKNHYGFQLGLFGARMLVRYTEEFAQNTAFNNNSVLAIEGRMSPGFSLGFVYGKPLGLRERFSFRITPAVSFYTWQWDYLSTADGGSVFTKQVEATEVELPLMVKWKANRRNNHRVYLLGGLQGSWVVNSKQDGGENNQMHLNSIQAGVTYGFGIQLYNQMFVLAPEIRVYHGVSNYINSNKSTPDNIFMDPLRGTFPTKVSLILNFEG